LGVMGFMAVTLALTGVFGMAAYGVSQRMKELGIRVALGASKTQLVTAAIERPLKLLSAGAILGLVAADLAKPLLAHVVYQADPNDLAIPIGAALTMALIGVAASALPAIRALAVDPASLMREE
jgi:ABC-type antimicrobial peptide transport system permease subunit